LFARRAARRDSHILFTVARAKLKVKFASRRNCKLCKSIGPTTSRLWPCVCRVGLSEKFNGGCAGNFSAFFTSPPQHPPATTTAGGEQQKQL